LWGLKVGLVALTLYILMVLVSVAWVPGLTLARRVGVDRACFLLVGDKMLKLRVKLATNLPIGLNYLRSLLRCSAKLVFEMNIEPKWFMSLPSMSSSLCK
jgi:hypothetical protein